jgi:hypothetical protein
MNTGSVLLELFDSTGTPLSGPKFECLFYHQTQRSLDRRFRGALSGAPLLFPEIPATPNGIFRVVLNVERRHSKQFFIQVHADRDLDLQETLLLQPGSARPVFPTLATIKSDPRFATLAHLLANSRNIKWGQLSPLHKAGLLNLHAKSSRVELTSGLPVFEYLTQVIELHPARLFALASPELLDIATQSRRVFSPASGISHHFPAGWQRIEDRGSFKTHESTANLQLTFATDPDHRLLVDMDIDDHQGIAHAFDVLKHALTNSDTHPYNIHQVLSAIHGIDPGYTLS